MTSVAEAEAVLQAEQIVSTWMQDYKRYLLDGDPNILHPKAKAALVLAFSEALDAVAPTVCTSPPDRTFTVRDKPSLKRRGKRAAPDGNGADSDGA